MPYGVKANIRAPHRFLRMGGLCWMRLLNPGWGGDKVMVYGITRSGRRAETWVDARDLTNFRAAWFMDPMHAMPFESRQAAEDWAAVMNERFASQPVRAHAAGFGRAPVVTA